MLNLPAECCQNIHENNCQNKTMLIIYYNYITPIGDIIVFFFF